MKVKRPIFFWPLTALFPIFLVATAEIAADGSANILLIVVQLSPLSLLPPLLNISLFFVCVMCAARRSWIAAAIIAVPVFLIAAVNYYRMCFTHLPFTMADLAYVEYSSALLTIIGSLPFSSHLILSLLLLAVYIAALWWVQTIPFPAKKRTTYRLALSCAFTIAILCQPAASSALMATCIHEGRTISATYQANGFLACFINETHMARVIASEPEQVPASLPRIFVPGISFVPVGAEQNMPDIIIVLSEAYWDPKQLPNIALSDNPTRNFDRLAKDGLSGHIMAPVFGGNTVQTEFEVLTGATVDVLPSLSTIPYNEMTGGIHTIASYLKSFGYQTMGLHTFDKDFYRRDASYPIMGFDDFFGIEDIPYDDIPFNGNYVADSILGRWIVDTLEGTDNPCFIMAITMENHGPYDERGTESGIEMAPADGITFGELAEDILTNFVKSLNEADLMLGAIADYLSERARPAVLLFMGDHLPFLGMQHIGYMEGGFLENSNEAQWDDQEFLRMYKAPFFIWGNNGNIPDDIGLISPYFLGGMLLTAAGLPLNDFYDTMASYRGVLPVSRRFIWACADGTVINALSPAQREYRQWHQAYSLSLFK